MCWCAVKKLLTHSLLIKLLPCILFEKYIHMLALEMASPENQHCASCIGTLSFPIKSTSWASAHRGKWGQLTPWKNGWKIKKRNIYILRAIRACKCRERRYADHIFIQMYFSMHHLVVKFSKFSSLQAAMGHWPPNQNPADALDIPKCCRVSRLAVRVCRALDEDVSRYLASPPAGRSTLHVPSASTAAAAAAAAGGGTMATVTWSARSRSASPAPNTSYTLPVSSSQSSYQIINIHRMEQYRLQLANIQLYSPYRQPQNI